MKTVEGEISKINCAQTQPADLTHTLDIIILLLRLLQKRALGKEAHLHQQTFFAKNDLLRVYTLCFCVFCFSCVCKFVEETKKKCLSHVISRILHSVGSLFLRLQCVGILLGRSFC